MLNSKIPMEDKRFDILIIGAGPAGLTASIYAGRAELKIGFIEGSVPGGKMTATDSIQNYPGFENINGGDLALSMFKQATNNNAKYIYGWVNNITKNEDSNTFTVTTSDNKQYFSKVVIIATGMKERKLKLQDEEKYENKGISYCAVCDGSLYANEDVAVVGGGNSAIQESLYLSKIVKKIYLIHRRDVFKADAVMLKQLREKSNVEFLIPYQVVEYIGNDKLTGIKIQNIETGEDKLLKVSCIFPYIGFNPSTGFLTNLGILNENNQIITNKNTKMTKIEGLYAVGDCTEQTFRQITTANSDGTIAALEAVDYINKNADSWNW